jgi:hypothetical protein
LKKVILGLGALTLIELPPNSHTGTSNTGKSLFKNPKIMGIIKSKLNGFLVSISAFQLKLYLISSNTYHLKSFYSVSKSKKETAWRVAHASD